MERSPDLSIDPLRQVFGNRLADFERAFRSVELNWDTVRAPVSERPQDRVFRVINPHARLANCLMLLELAIRSSWITLAQLESATLFQRNYERLLFVLQREPAVSRTCTVLRYSLGTHQNISRVADDWTPPGGVDLYGTFLEVRDDLLDVIFDDARDQFIGHLADTSDPLLPEINFWKKVERLPRNASLDVLTYLDQRASSVEPDVRLPDQHLQAYLDEFCSYLTSLEILDGVTRYVILEHDTSNKRSDDVPPWQAEFERVLFVLSGTMLGFLGSQIAAKRFVSHHLAGYVSLLTRSAGASAARNAERRVSDFSTFLSNKVKLFAIDLDKMKAQFDEGLFALK